MNRTTRIVRLAWRARCVAWLVWLPFLTLHFCAYPTTGHLFDTTESEGQFVLIGILNGGFGTSARIGFSWEYFASPGIGARYDATAVVFQGRVWLLGGQDAAGTRYTEAFASEDGITFTSRGGAVPNDNTMPDRPAAVVFNGILYYAVRVILPNGDSYLRIYESPDGLSYTQRYAYLSALSDSRGTPALAVFNGRLYAHDFRRQFYSDDGITWTDGGTIAGSADQAGVSSDTAVFNGVLVREIGTEFLVSPNAIDYSYRSPGGDGYVFQNHLVFDGRLFSVLTTGATSVMFETRDLQTRATASLLNSFCCRTSPFAFRQGYASVVFRNRMRFYGGRDLTGLGVYGDAWFSLGGGVGQDGETHTDFSR